MKKLFKTLMGTFLLVAGLFPIFCAKNNANPAYAAEGDRVTDVISIDTIKSSGITITAQSFSTKNIKQGAIFHNEYKIDTKLGSNVTSTDEMKEKNQCLYMESGDFASHPVGLMSKKRIGFVKSVSIQFGDYSIIQDDFGTISLYVSNDDEAYTTPGSTPGIIYQKEVNELAYQFTLDKLDNNYTDKVTFEKNDYKYIGIIVDQGNRLTRVPSYIKSISIEWELYDFTDVVDCEMTTDGISIGPNETYQIPTPETTGNGVHTGGKVVYTIEDSDIATVDENGLITAAGYGHTTVKIQYGTDYIYRDIFVMNPIYLNTSATANRVETATDLKEGDVVLFVRESGEESSVLSLVEKDGNIGVETGCIVSKENQVHTLSNYENGELFCVLGNSEDGFVFKSFTSEYLAYNIYAEDGEYFLTNGGSAITWNVEITNGSACIKNVFNQEKALYYDTVFECFDVMSSGASVAIYKTDYFGATSGVLVNDISNGNSPALNFSEKFLEEMGKVCDYNGINTDTNDLLAKWKTLFSNETNEYKQLTAFSNVVFECAQANADGDPIQKALYLYDLILVKYGYLFDEYNYLNRDVPANAARFSPDVFFKDDNGGTLLCILLVSSFALLSSTFLLIRKKKNCQ